MRLATFNILHGRSLEDGRVSTERLIAACESLEADVLCLQEVDYGQARSGNVDQIGVIAQAMGARWWRFAPALIGEPGGRWRPAVDEDAAPVVDAEVSEPRGPASYGVGMISRREVRAWHVVRLKAARVRSPVVVPGGRGRFVLLPDEPRVALAAELAGETGPLLVATTHLSFVPFYNAWQLRQLTTALAGLASSCVLLGDLNLPAPFPRWVSGWTPAATARTFPAQRPRVQVDHVLTSGDVPAVVAASTRRLSVADHLALVVDLAEAGGR